MRVINIVVNNDGSLEVNEKHLTSGVLSWDEMLGQVAAMTLPSKRIESLNGSLYPMRTRSDWAKLKENIINQIQESNNE